MFLAALRDLQWRRRRFVITIVGTALVFAMTLDLAGLAASFSREVRLTVRSFGADHWVLAEGSWGPFTNNRPLPPAAAAAVLASVPSGDATPVVVGRLTLDTGSVQEALLVGVDPTGFAAPRPQRGTGLRRAGDVVLSSEAPGKVGETLRIGPDSFRIVGKVRDRTVLAGLPLVYLPLTDARQIAFQGRDLSSAVVTRGAPPDAPAGTTVRSNADVRADTKRPLTDAEETIRMNQVMLWVVAACVLGSVIYLSAIERARDVAVMKATGTSTGPIAAGLGLQAVVLAALSSLLAMGLASLLVPFYAMPIHIPASAYLTLPLVALIVGVIGSLAGLSRMLKVEPALAFGGA